MIRLKDNFVDTPGTALAAHTMDVGPGWTVPVGTPIINPSGTALTDGTFGCRGMADATIADIDMHAFVAVTGTGFHGLLFRGVSSADFLVCYFNPASSTIEVDHWVSGSETLLASATHSFSAGVFYAVDVRCQGTQIFVFVDGNVALTLSSGVNLAGTICGLYSQGGTASFETFEVDDFAPASAFVLSDLAKKQLLADYTSAELLTLRLYTNNFAPSHAMVSADFTELSGVGYSPILLVGWSTPLIDGALVANTTASVATFTLDGSTPFLVYGWFITDSGGDVHAAALFAAPVNVNTAAFPLPLQITLRDQWDSSLSS